jgi:predicted Zn-dependent peptidase
VDTVLLDTGLRRSDAPSGLVVLSETMPSVRSAALGVFVRSASAHEPRGKMGVSHLLEHMVFKGTERRNAHEIALSLEALGGSLDAYTSREHTVYQGRVLDEHLADAADVIADIVFRPSLRASDLALERKVILEEIGMVEDTPDDLVFEIHNEALWGRHPYGYSILGTRDTVNSLGVTELRELHARAYHPGHVVIAAAGNVEHDRLLDVLSRTGWTDAPSGDVTRLVSPPPAASPPSTQHVAREGAQTHIVAGCTALAHSDPERFPFLLLSMLLGGGMSSRLFQRVREEMGLAYSIYSFQSFHEDSGMHGVYVATAPGSAADALDAIRHELQSVVDDGLPSDEVAMGRQQLKGQVTLSLESVSSRMYRAASVELYDEPYRTLDEVLALIDAISVDDVARVARAYFDPARMTVVSLGPKGTD